MNLRQQIIEDQVEKITNLLGVDADHAFLRLVHSLVVGRSIHAFDLNDLVDGGQDKQVDLITIEEDGNSADVYILQAKNTGSFSSNVLIQMANGLKWIFERPRKDISTLANHAFRDKIYEYRSVQSSVGPSNIRVHVDFVTNGSTANLSDEFEQERRAIYEAFSSVFESFEIRAQGADELVAMLKSQEREGKKINADLRIRYDANNPSIIKYYSQGLKGLVCTVSAQEIARLVNADPTGSIFDLNIRRFLGGKGAVNQDILATCSARENSYEFWFLNNGLTVVCDSFDAVTDPDEPILKLKNMQIVNGCQTATTLAMAQSRGVLAPDVRILVRVYETTDTALVDKIVLTTNNQNKISSRDLRANDPVQIDMETACSIYGYHYERKVRQFDRAGVSVSRILPNELVGQWYLAVVLKNPADARGRKYKVWSEHYAKIFGGGPIEPYIIATLVGRYIGEWLRGSELMDSDDDLKRMLAKRGSFHIGRIASFLWRNGDEWGSSQKELAAEISMLDSDPTSLKVHAERAFEIIEEIIRKNGSFNQDIDRTLKSHSLDEAIDRKLYSGYKQKRRSSSRGTVPVANRSKHSRRS